MKILLAALFAIGGLLLVGPYVGAAVEWFAAWLFTGSGQMIGVKLIGCATAIWLAWGLTFGRGL